MTEQDGPQVRPLAFTFAVNGALYGTVLPRFAEIADRLDASATAFGLALLAAGVGGSIGSALVTRVNRRFGGPRRVVVALVPVMAVGVALAGVAPSLVLFALALGGLSLADGMVDPAMNAVVVDEQRRTGQQFMGRMHATWSGSTLSFTGLGALAAAFAIPVAVHVPVVALGLAGLHVVVGRPLRVVPDGPPPEVGSVRDSPGAPALGEVSHAPATGATSLRPRGPVGLVRAWVPVAVLAIAAVWIEIPPQEWSGLLLSRELGASTGLAAAGPFAAVAGVLLGRLGLDRAVARLGWRLVALTAMSVTVLGSAAGLLLGSVLASPWPVLVGLVVAGTGVGPVFPLLFELAEDLAVRVGLAPDAGSGLVSVLARVAMVVAPVVIGVVGDATTLFMALGTVPVAAALLLWAMWVLVPRAAAAAGPRAG